nr:hypothetical protein [Rhodovulum marinum]
MTTIPYNAVHTPSYLVRQIRQVKRAQKAPNADLHLVRGPLVHRTKFYPGKVEPFPNAREVLLVSRQAIERFHENDIELSQPRFMEQLHQPVTPVDGRPGTSPVGIGCDNRKVVSGGMVPAEMHLIFDRTVVLQFSRETGVDRGLLHQRSSPGASAAIWRLLSDDPPLRLPWQVRV